MILQNTNNLMLDDFINEQCNAKNISEFYCAVGFLFESGLKLIQKSIDKISIDGRVEFIIGSLQNYIKNSLIKKMNKGTAEYINNNLLQNKISIFTYPPEFYHGKYNYLADDKESLVIVGSSNID